MTELFGKESAKAIQKATDASREFGGFFKQYFGGSLEQWTGLWEDKLRYRRWENQLALMQKLEERVKSLKLENKIRPLSMKIGVSLLEAASLEEDDYLRELWANLLVNSVDKDSSNVHPAYIQILQNLLPEEAKLLKFANDTCGQVRDFVAFADDGYSHLPSSDDFDTKKIEAAESAGLSGYDSSEIIAWFDNLIRLELFQIEAFHESEYHPEHGDRNGTYDPSVTTTFYKAICVSAFGEKFIESVS